MLLASPHTVFELVKLLNFIHRTLQSAGSDLKTILMLYDNPSTQLANDILCSSRLQSLDVSWSTINVDVKTNKSILKRVLPLTLAVLKDELLETLMYGSKSIDIYPLKKNNIILINPFEMSDEFTDEFRILAKRLPIFLVKFDEDNIRVVFHSHIYDMTVAPTEFKCAVA